MLDICGSTSIYPLDLYLRLDKLPYKMTPDLMTSICEIVLDAKSYERAENMILKAHKVSVSDDEARHVVDTIGSLVFNADLAKAQRARKLYEDGLIPHDHSRNGTLYLSTDGAYVNTRFIVNDSGWHECKLALAFHDFDVEEYHTAQSDDAMNIMHKKYRGLIGTVDDFKWNMLALALENGYGAFKKTVLLADGAPWIRLMQESLFPCAIRILDRYHLFENVGKYGNAMIKGKNAEARRTEWNDATCKKLDEGKWKEVLGDIEKRFGDKKPPKGIVNLPKYINDNVDAIDYPRYREEGLITNTASMESSNKSVTQDRLKGPGKRWNIPTGQGILSLKAKYEGEEWMDVIRLVRSTFS